jgi:hypothetical protein
MSQTQCNDCNAIVLQKFESIHKNFLCKTVTSDGFSEVQN